MRTTIHQRQLDTETVHDPSLSHYHNYQHATLTSQPRLFSFFNPLRPQHQPPTKRVVAQAAASAPEATAQLNIVDQALVLTADIGGTNCRLQLWSIDLNKGIGEDRAQELFNKTYAVEDYPSASGFEMVLDSMLDEDVFQNYQPQAACFAVAGPVIDGTVEFTNSGWVINSRSISQKFKWQVALLNDFEAVGYGVANIPQDQIVNLRPEVKPTLKAPMVVLGPGTGLGEAQLMWDTGMNGYKVWPSEGAHADFAPRGWKQQKLLEFCENELLKEGENDRHCEVEHVACGSGLGRIYKFLTSDRTGPKTLFGKEVESRSEQESNGMSPADISKAAAEGTDPYAEQAMDMFLSIIGQEAGHMALRAMAYGGVYIAGGIIPKNLERAMLGGIVEGFLNPSSRFNKVLQRFPLFLVKTEDVGLIGTREYAVNLLQERFA